MVGRDRLVFLFALSFFVVIWVVRVRAERLAGVALSVEQALNFGVVYSYFLLETIVDFL